MDSVFVFNASKGPQTNLKGFLEQLDVASSFN